MQLFIVFSIFGVMNGRCKMGVTIFNDLIENNEIMFSKKMNNYSFKENTKGIIYMVPLLFVFFLLYTLCGYFYSDTDLYNQNYNYISTTSGKIYSFAGVTTSWTGIFSFILIALAFLGTIKNRKTNKIKNTKDKYFLIYS
ncbi:hypothetical protein FACS189459_0800 [Bacilli bacterium]|nr:hypothetical protein FACS189459_0800 [Bacilli bacterium]